MMGLVLGNVMFLSPIDVLLYCKIAFIFVSLTVHVAIARPPCHVNQITIQSSEGTQCVDCPNCPEGLGLSPQCGSHIKPGIKIECMKCPAGISYSDVDDILACKPCSICGPNEETIHTCTPTKNAICGKCRKGFYREVTGDCKPCSRCCGKSNEKVIEECINHGLSTKDSCRYDLDTIKCAGVDTNHTNVRAEPAPNSVEKDATKYGLSTIFGMLVGVAVLVALAVCGSYILFRYVRPRYRIEELIKYAVQQPVDVTVIAARAGDHDSQVQVVTGASQIYNNDSCSLL